MKLKDVTKKFDAFCNKHPLIKGLGNFERMMNYYEFIDLNRNFSHKKAGIVCVVMDDGNTIHHVRTLLNRAHTVTAYFERLDGDIPVIIFLSDEQKFFSYLESEYNKSVYNKYKILLETSGKKKALPKYSKGTQFEAECPECENTTGNENCSTCHGKGTVLATLA